MTKQLQVFFRTLLIGILALGASAQFAAMAQIPEITMTTTKAIGEKISLTIQAEGDVSIEGATGNFVNGRSVIYTLKKQTITVKGKVTTLRCIQNQITSLDVSKNAALTELYCAVNLLTNLDVSKNTALTSLDCILNQLTTLDVSKNTTLTQLDCRTNRLANLDVSKNTALTKLSCQRNQLASLDVSQNTALTELNCSANQLTNLDVSKNTALTWLDCYENQLTSLDLSKSIALIWLDCERNRLSSLDVSKNTALNYLICPSNPLGSLDVSKNVALIELNCATNQLTSLDVSKNTALTELSCHTNQIKSEAMKGLIKSLHSLPTGKKGEICIVDTKNLEEGNICTKTMVAAAQDKGWRVTDFNGKWDDRKDYAGSEEEAQEDAITMTTAKEIGDKIKLNIKASGEVSIDGATGAFVSGKDVEYTLTKQNITIKGRVMVLGCSENQLTSLDVSKSTALTELFCYTNQLTSLDVSKNTALTGLYCTTNQLTDLDVSKNTALIDLYCSENRLTNLNVSGNTALVELFCHTNQIKGEAMARLVESLPKREQSEFCAIDTKNTKEQNICTKANIAIAKGKGWRVTDYNGSWMDRTDYTGSEEETQEYVITMTTAKKVGDKIKFSIIAEGDVSIDGATGAFVNVMPVEYTLTNQTITIKGKVTLFLCSNSQLTALDVSKNTILTGFSCFGNQLTSLDVSKNTALTRLLCYNNQLTSLDVSKNTALIRLSCEYNQLTNLDVSKNMALTRLSCESNQLTSLDVSKNTALTILSCFSNQIKDEAMTGLVNSLPTCDKGEFCVIDTKNAKEGNICTKEQVTIAKGKGWRVMDFNGSWDDYKDYEGSRSSVAAINSSSVQIYPNPATDFVQIEGAKGATIVRLYSLDGRLVLTSRVDTDGATRLDVSTLATGEYLLVVGDECSKLFIK